MHYLDDWIIKTTNTVVYIYNINISKAQFKSAGWRSSTLVRLVPTVSLCTCVSIKIYYSQFAKNQLHDP